MGGGFVRTDYKIKATEIEANAVTTSTIASEAVTLTKLAVSAVTLDGLIALGSYSSATQAGGKDSISHGLSTAPAGVWMTPIAADALTAYGRQVRLMTISAAAFSFITVSAPPTASQVITCVGSVIASTQTVTFIWGAHL